MYRMKSTARRILAMLLSLALLVSVLPTFALGADAAKDPLKKLDAKLVEALQNASATDQIPVWIWLDGPSRLALEDMIAQECGPEPGQGCTAEEANAYLAARRAVIKRETVSYNEKFMAEVLPEVSASDIGYFSKYTATIGAYLTVAQIRAAAYDSRVNDLSLYEDHPLVSGGEEEEPLTLEEQICADYYASLKDPEVQPEDVYIKKYYGCWGGYHVVLMENERMLKLDEVLYLSVAGFTFEFPSISDKSLFLAWRDGEFTPVKEAYEKGLLRVKDIYELHQAFYNNAQPPCFLDVCSPNAFYFEPVYWAYGAEITKGINNTRFGPNESCTRGQVVTFLWRAAGYPASKSVQTKFSDVGKNSFCAKAVAWAVENDITRGVTETTFCPNDPCTRAQVVTFLHRAWGRDDPIYNSSSFGDINPNNYYFDAVAWAEACGIVKGTSANKFSPNNPCTRAQVVTFLYRASSIANAAGPMPSGSE